MAAHRRGADGEEQGIGRALKDPLGQGSTLEGEKPRKAILSNKAGTSRSPYVRAHGSNPVAWQVWGDEAIALAKRENRLLFVSIGYSACHCEYLARTVAERG
jgi:hypothetical protein